MQLGYPYPKRTAHLKKLYGTLAKRTYDVRFQGKLQTFPIHNVPVELPKYRLNNGRTLAAQAQYLAKHPDLPTDFFKKDLELEDAQNAQHEILRRMVDERAAREELLDFFRRNEQEQPLILNHDGFVVNGNRRLCAMRILLAEDKQKHKRYEHLDIVILPPATEEEIDDLEAELQIHQDIKADYAWTARAFLYKWRKIEHSYTDDDIARRYQLGKGEVREWIQMLEYADRYLASRDKVEQYEEVEADEYAFRQLTKNRSKLFKTEGQRNVFEQISYCLIDDPEGGRLYEKIPSAGRFFDKVVSRLREDLKLQPVTTTPSDGSLLGGVPDEVSDVLAAVEDKKNSARVRDIVIDVVDGEVAKEKEQKRSDFVFSQVRKASTALIEALNGITESTEKNGISGQLDSITKSVEQLRKWLR